MLLDQINQFVRQLPAGRRVLALVWGALGGAYATSWASQMKETGHA
jgi:hypothetical protein